METLTLDRALKLAQEAIAEKGEDFLYTNPRGDRMTCYYVHTDEEGSNHQPGCIVGNMLLRNGFDIQTLLENNTQRISGLIRDGVVSATPEARTFLQDLQSGQDCGSSWGKAFQRAKAYTEAVYAQPAEV